MIEEQAQVIEVKGAKLILQAQTQSTCGGCAVNKSCGTSLLSKVVGRKFTQFEAENNIGADVGDTVIVGIAEDALLKGSMVIYAVPILGMIVLAVLAEFMLPELAARDLAIAASGIMGLIFGSITARWYFQRQSSVHLYAPVVLRKVEPANSSLPFIITTSR